MVYDLSNTLVVWISSRALFDMNESGNLFRKLMVEDPDNAIRRYRVVESIHGKASLTDILSGFLCENQVNQFFCSAFLAKSFHRCAFFGLV